MCFFIDGYTQCGASPNTEWITGDAVLKIEIRGDNNYLTFGLHLLSPNNQVQGLALYDWHRQIDILGSRAHDNLIVGNFLGTDLDNDHTQVAPGIEGEGIRIQLGAAYNRVGSATPAERNIISGNDQDGIGLQGHGADNNLFYNNYVGLAQTGDRRLRNGADGVDVAEGVADNWIGGLEPGQRNIISGNNRDGVELSHDTETVGNRIVGNFIGLAPDGVTSGYNGGRGVTFEDSVMHNPVYRNVIVNTDTPAPGTPTVTHTPTATDTPAAGSPTPTPAPTATATRSAGPATPAPASDQFIYLPVATSP